VKPARLPERFTEHLGRTGLLAGPGLALLAVSGGSDSMALLDLAAGVAAGLDLRLLVVHADHGIHPDAAAVAARVAETAHQRYGLETVVERLALGSGASETRARTARYRFFRRLQQAREARYLVTAHHADDQAETVLLRLLRGSAPVGLAGIAARGPRGLVRPLLPFRRAELAAHAAAAGLPVYDDPANADLRHGRSWVRHQLLPAIIARGGDGAVEALLAVTRHAAADTAAWDAVLDALSTLDVRAGEGCVDVARSVLAGYSEPLASRLVRAMSRRAGIRLGPAAAARVAALAVGASGRQLALGESLVAETAFDRLVLRRARQGEALAPIELSGPNGAVRAGRYQVRWCEDAAPPRLERGGWTTWVAPGTLRLRAPAAGEAMVPLGGPGHREVRRLLMEARVPRAARAQFPVLVRDDEAVWLPGICRAAAAIPAPGTRAVRIDAAAE
jgi:tRNA(Ile)-lysidine synthase